VKQAAEREPEACGVEAREFATLILNAVE